MSAECHFPSLALKQGSLKIGCHPLGVKGKDLWKGPERLHFQRFLRSHRSWLLPHTSHFSMVSCNVIVLPVSMPLIMPFTWPLLALCLSKYNCPSETKLTYFLYKAVLSSQPCTISPFSATWLNLDPEPSIPGLDWQWFRQCLLTLLYIYFFCLETCL